MTAEQALEKAREIDRHSWNAIAAALLEAYADGVAVWSTPAELTSIAEIARAEAAKIRGGA